MHAVFYATSNTYPVIGLTPVSNFLTCRFSLSNTGPYMYLSRCWYELWAQKHDGSSLWFVIRGLH